MDYEFFSDNNDFRFGIIQIQNITSTLHYRSIEACNTLIITRCHVIVCWLSCHSQVVPVPMPSLCTKIIRYQFSILMLLHPISLYKLYSFIKFLCKAFEIFIQHSRPQIYHNKARNSIGNTEHCKHLHKRYLFVHLAVLICKLIQVALLTWQFVPLPECNTKQRKISFLKIHGQKSVSWIVKIKLQIIGFIYY